MIKNCVFCPRKFRYSRGRKTCRYHFEFIRNLDSRDRTREYVRIRDNHTCRGCGKKWRRGTRRFDVHHVGDKKGLKTKGYDRVSNTRDMVTYCHKCHLNLPSERRKMMAGIRRYEKSKIKEKI